MHYNASVRIQLQNERFVKRTLKFDNMEEKASESGQYIRYSALVESRPTFHDISHLRKDKEVRQLCSYKRDW